MSEIEQDFRLTQQEKLGEKITRNIYTPKNGKNGHLLAVTEIPQGGITERILVSETRHISHTGGYGVLEIVGKDNSVRYLKIGNEQGAEVSVFEGERVRWKALIGGGAIIVRERYIQHVSKCE